MTQENSIYKKLMLEFSENYMEKVFYFCLKKTGNDNEAEDLASDISLNILISLDRGTVPANFSAWVWQVARNRYSVWADKKHRTAVSVINSGIDDLEIHDERADILEEMIHSEEMSLIRRELAFISSDYRNIVVSYYIDNKRITDIAKSLNLPEGTVASKLHRAKKILKEGMSMAREFGKRSYNPDKIYYTNVCDNPGKLGQPWTLMDPKLNQNIFLEGYDNPLSAEEYALEMGVALPYMEDTLEHLVRETLLVKHNNKYETAFPIISSDTLQKIHKYYSEIIPRLVPLIEEDIDKLMEQFREAGLLIYGEYLSYEDAKWMLLMDLYKDLYYRSKDCPVKTLGNTKRPDDGIWDVVGFEAVDYLPGSVGYHCGFFDFKQYRFGYKKICERTPAHLSKEEALTMQSIAKGEVISEPKYAQRLVEYGYASKDGTTYKPKIVVFKKTTIEKFLDFCNKGEFSQDFKVHASLRKTLTDSILDCIKEMYSTLNDIFYHDLPKYLRVNEDMVESLVNTYSTTSYTLGYILEQALADGWLKYDDITSPAVGASITI